MARRRAKAVKRGRPIPRGRGSRGPSRGRPMSRGRSRRRAQSVKRPTSPRGPRGSQAASKSPRGRAMASKSPRGRAMAKMSPSQVRSLRARSPRARGPQGPQSRATSRPTINPGQELKKFMDTMPRAPRAGGPQGPMKAQQNRNFAVPQRPIPNRDGRMAQMQADINRANMAAMANARQRPPSISMDPSKGTFGKGMQQSNYMRQQMSPQQSQNAMGRGPMPRANIGSVQTPQLNFNKQINQSPRGRRGRVIPRRR